MRPQKQHQQQSQRNQRPADSLHQEQVLRRQAAAARQGKRPSVRHVAVLGYN